MVFLAQDPYAVLGMPQDATDKDLKAAHRRLAKKFHPDRNPGDPHAAEKFKEIQWAYESIQTSRAQKCIQDTAVWRKCWSDLPPEEADPALDFLWRVRAHYNKKS